MVVWRAKGACPRHLVLSTVSIQCVSIHRDAVAYGMQVARSTTDYATEPLLEADLRRPPLSSYADINGNQPPAGLIPPSRRREEHNALLLLSRRTEQVRQLRDLERPHANTDEDNQNDNHQVLDNRPFLFQKVSVFNCSFITILQ